MPRFQKSERLHSSQDFNRLKAQAYKIGTRMLSVAFLPADRAVRLGVVAGRKAGGAVERNRVKRIVRECFRLNRQDLPKGDYVVIMRPSAAVSANSAIREGLEKALSQIKQKFK